MQKSIRILFVSSWCIPYRLRRTVDSLFYAEPCEDHRVMLRVSADLSRLPKWMLLIALTCGLLFRVVPWRFAQKRDSGARLEGKPLLMARAEHERAPISLSDVVSHGFAGKPCSRRSLNRGLWRGSGFPSGATTQQFVRRLPGSPKSPSVITQIYFIRYE